MCFGRSFVQAALVARSSFPPEPAAPPLLQDRTLLNNSPTAYLCRHFTCLQPVNTARELKNQLENDHSWNNEE